MTEERERLLQKTVANWVLKAENDLTIAKDERFLKKDGIVTDGICFHCQQAAEKYLKAFLVFHSVDFEKTHNLEFLANLCKTISADFGSLEFGNLTNYGISVRYPDDFYMPTLDEADEALKIAERIKSFVVNKIKA
ncbi:MAG: HEPN domain-containing protein [Chitinivibrionales bacterium]|nr:HEPN domain-containing protein [Chitinivibrionales bacterium]